uniref:Uncharacterized protein n=1 Tax=Arundo donax TaxID=35708 RepID=A0A0A9ADY1_ARUDO
MHFVLSSSSPVPRRPRNY